MSSIAEVSAVCSALMVTPRVAARSRSTLRSGARSPQWGRLPFGVRARPRVRARAPAAVVRDTDRRMAAALGWGALSASSLLVGVLLGVRRRWPDRQVGAVLAFGAGALISAVSFELLEEGARVGGAGWLALGLGA